MPIVMSITSVGRARSSVSGRKNERQSYGCLSNYFIQKGDYPSFGASTGQTLAQVPHSVHFSGSIT